MLLFHFYRKPGFLLMSDRKVRERGASRAKQERPSFTFTAQPSISLSLTPPTQGDKAEAPRCQSTAAAD